MDEREACELADDRYTEDRERGVAYLDVFPCNDAAALRTLEVCGSVLIDIRADTDDVAGIELLNLDSPFARWLAAAAAALSAQHDPSISHPAGTAYQLRVDNPGM